MFVVVEFPMTFKEEKSIDSNAVQSRKACCIATVPVTLSNADKSTLCSLGHPLNAYAQHDAPMVVNAGNEAVTMFVEFVKA